MKKYIPLILFAFGGIGIISCIPENNLKSLPKGQVQLDFEAVVNTAPLVMNTGTYTNSSSENYTVTSFKYYVHPIALINTTAGNTYYFNNADYFLIDAADPASSSIILKVPSFEYDQVAFMVGVDSIYNVSGAQTGALDPTKGMFWTWSTGYIMAKLEGNTPVSTQPNNRFQYHIGGFRQANSVLKQVTLKFPANQLLSVKAGKTSSVTISADINKWFEGTTTISFTNNAVIMGPGPLAQSIAENYSHMFSIVKVTNN